MPWLRFALLGIVTLVISNLVWGQTKPAGEPAPTTAPEPFTVVIKPIQVFERKGQSCFIDFSPDGKLLAIGGDRRVRLWDIATGKQTAEYIIEDNGRFTFHTLFSPDGKTFACTAGVGRVVSLLDTASGKLLRQLGSHPDSVRDIRFAPDGKSVVTVCNDGVLRIWDVGTGDEIKKSPFGKLEGEISSAAFSPDGKRIAIGINDSLCVLDTASGKEVCHFPRCKDPSASERGPVFSPDGRYLAVASTDDNEIRVWDVLEEKLAAEFQWKSAPKPPVGKGPKRAGEDGANALAFSQDGRMLVAACCDDQVRVWEVNTGGLRYQAEESTPTVAAAPIGTLLATANLKEGSIRVWSGLNPGRTALQALTPKQIDQLWTDLEGQDAGQAYQAIVTLATAPVESIKAIGQRLKRVEPVDAVKLDQLIMDLDDNTFATREAASRDLRVLGAAAKARLVQGMEKEPPAETRRRMQALLDELKGPPKANLLRSLRALEVLEFNGTAEARRVLQDIAKGATGALVTEEAKAALKRLGPDKQVPAAGKSSLVP